MRSSAVAVSCGRLACLAQLLPTARAHLRRIFPDVSEEMLLAAVPLQGASDTIQALEARGIALAAGGGIARGSEPRLDITKPFQPVPGLMGTITRAIACQDREATLNALRSKGHLRSVARLRSAVGGAGVWVEAIPNRLTLQLRDAEFVTGMRWRLGLPMLPDGLTCQNKAVVGTASNQGAEKRCGCNLDIYGDHIAICSRGGGTYRIHGGIGKLVAGFARDAGAWTEEEVVVPELLQGEPGGEDAVEARLDLHIWAPAPWPMEFWVDVTHRHPWATRYRTAAVHNDGAAATAGEKYKAKRYGEGRDGVTVTAAAIESWGRLSPGFEWLLGCLEARAGAASELRGGSTAALGRRWRQEIGITQVRALHLSLTRGAGGSGDASGQLQAAQ